MAFKKPDFFEEPALLYGNEDVDDIQGVILTELTEISQNGLEQFKQVAKKYISRALRDEKFRMPRFGEGLQWYNTSREISYDDLEGKVYVVDFFTYCCVNCQHIQPVLKHAQFLYNYPGFAIIGVQSPKFPAEKEAINLKKGILKSGIKHPVLNDVDLSLWKQLNVTCWPSVLIIGPGHTILFALAGEPQIAKLNFLLKIVFDFIFENAIQLDPTPLPILLLSDDPCMEFQFPGNVSTNGNHILVSDTGHHRLILMSKSFEHEKTIGCGAAGFKDGKFEEAKFNSPHGTTWHENSIYVADTGNHSIRKVCFTSKTVTTIFSKEDNEKRLSCDPADPQSEFKSPWDLCVGPRLGNEDGELEVLYIAVAGSHQIWAMHLKAPTRLNNKRFCEPNCIPFAGTGKEANKANLYRLKACFAQPSGITYSNISPGCMYIADSESSTIKMIDMRTGAVTILVGASPHPDEDSPNVLRSKMEPTKLSPDLFNFGDKDGQYRDAKLQHPLGVCVIKDKVVAITDTYNNKVKIIDAATKICKTYFVNEILSEPGGMCFLDDQFIIADTNNHRIVKIPFIKDGLYKSGGNNFENYDESVTIGSIEEDVATGASSPKVCVNHNGQLDIYFSLEEDSRYAFSGRVFETKSVNFEGDGRFVKIEDNGFLFMTRQPSIILRAYCLKPHNAGQVCDVKDTSTEATFKFNMPLCDKRLGICLVKVITFKFIINTSNEGSANVSLELKIC